VGCFVRQTKKSLILQAQVGSILGIGRPVMRLASISLLIRVLQFHIFSIATWIFNASLKKLLRKSKMKSHIVLRSFAELNILHSFLKKF